ncbi:MAG: YajQ family cyclic di-GMP-binding protein [Nitrospinae bacterium]|nr:YajQ family cyclic di-GMP-binding protein [Nitrospinota bacterium]
MAKECSFDIVCKTDMVEVKNAVNQAIAEIRQRFDFKGSKSEIDLNEKENKITCLSDDQGKLKNLMEILHSKMVKRGISLKALKYGAVDSASGGTVRQEITLQQGISQEDGKEIVKLIKGSGLKVQASIQKDQVRVVGKNKDDLQAVISALKGQKSDIEMQFINYR